MAFGHARAVPSWIDVATPSCRPARPIRCVDIDCERDGCCKKQREFRQSYHVFLRRVGDRKWLGGLQNFRWPLGWQGNLEQICQQFSSRKPGNSLLLYEDSAAERQSIRARCDLELLLSPKY